MVTQSSKQSQNQIIQNKKSQSVTFTIAVM